ncbi:MAG: N-hydroxyarylamine O-acetyltransferase [Candidatus Azotimanducaceae bacterium]|jgi:N-hydroxyarylamine O-acetyltransferase
MRLEKYLKRINYSGPLNVDLETLNNIQRHHLLAIPYEDLDVQLGRPLTTNVVSAYDKIVNQGRGGWCYEMNGVLGWALEEIGFDIQRVCGGVNRAERGDEIMGNHLVLLANLGTTYVVDTGFGDGFLHPIPLEERAFTERGFEFKLEALADGHWRFHNHEFGGAPSFDFKTEPADETQLENLCQHLQKYEQSPFVMVLIAQRFVADGYEIQLGRAARSITAKGVKTTLLNSADELQARLKTVFGLDVPKTAELWPTIVERHEQLFADKNA